MRIRTRFALAFGVLFFIVAVTFGLIAYNLVQVQDDYQQFINVELRQAELAGDIRYYDVLLTDTVRAHLLDPENEEHLDNYVVAAQALDATFAEARAAATSEEELQIFANIEALNTQLITIEESILAQSDVNAANALYRGAYATLKADFASNVDQLFELDRQIKLETEESLNNAINQAIFVTAVLVGVLLVVGILIIGLLTRSILNPLGALNRASKEISDGNFDVEMPPTRPDEIGSLRDSFVAMVNEIRLTLESLESRTRDLQTVADVNDQISTILNLDRLLQDVADLTKERFGLYHAHIYSYNAERSSLDLTAGAGHVGRQMVAEERTIDMANPESVVAQAARSRSNVSIGDVRASATFLPHRLLPETRSEFAVALVARGQLLGVLDVQSNKADYFSEEVAEVLGLMAGQIASAISNANLFTTAERASRFEQAIGRLDRQLQSAVDIDEILQSTVRELGKALRVSNTTVELSLQGWDAAPGNGQHEPSAITEPGESML
jgi:nitrate/nitrite-specific signal transduction histidine kinase